MNNVLYVKQAAQVLNCHENTIRNLEKTGKLAACRDYRNRRVFQISDVLKVKNEREHLKKSQ
ncbi:MAG: helix-turn-helix domain-containing protein [Desulfobacterales bacterium]|nr:helix-turn-helix domain-containing protein [Desulfobacterales bacterium]